MTPHYVNQGGELNWLLDDLVNRVPQVSKAVMLTQDGLAIGASAGLNGEDAEHLAALAAGFQSMARGAGQPADYTQDHSPQRLPSMAAGHGMAAPQPLPDAGRSPPVGSVHGVSRLCRALRNGG